MARTLYQTLLGPAFRRLPEPIRSMHEGADRAEGRADIVRGTSFLARIICLIARVPQTGRDISIVTHFERIEGGERWTRVFNGEAFRTDMRVDLSAIQPRLTEKFGPFLFHLKMIAHQDGIDLIPDSVSLWGFSLPKMFCPEAIGLERVKDGRYHFDVSVRFPLAGEILRYSGTIEPVT